MKITVLDQSTASIHIRMLVQEAAVRVEGQEPDFVDGGLTIGEAMFYDADTFRPAPSWRPIVPTLGLQTGKLSGSPSLEVPPGADFLDVTEWPSDQAIEAIAEWLRSHIPSLVQRDRIKLEKLIQELHRVLDNHEFRSEDRDDVAQAHAAMETMEAQIKAPRPSRLVLKWAASQIPGFVIGLMSNVGNDMLTHFVHI